MNRFVFAFFAVLVFTSRAFATAQASDYLLIDGQQHAINSNPLERFFDAHPEKRPKSPVQNTALWRGYIAYFEIVNGELWVKDIKVHGPRDNETNDYPMVSVIDQVFPKANERQLSSYTGFLILPQGKITQYIHMGYASRYEGYRLILIKDGRVAADSVFTAGEYDEYKKLQFEAFKRTERYSKMKESLDAKNSSPPNAEYFLYIFDVDFPVETLIDYKDFRPNSAGSVKK